MNIYDDLADTFAESFDELSDKSLERLLAVFDSDRPLDPAKVLRILYYELDSQKRYREGPVE